MSVYPDLIGKIRIMIYNGDQDNCIPYTQDESWTAQLGLAVTGAWRPWMVDRQVAGYSTQYVFCVLCVAHRPGFGFGNRRQAFHNLYRNPVVLVLGVWVFGRVSGWNVSCSACIACIPR